MSVFSEETRRLMAQFEALEPDQTQAVVSSSSGHNSSSLAAPEQGLEPGQVVPLPPSANLAPSNTDFYADGQNLLQHRQSNPTLITRWPLLQESQQQQRASSGFGDENPYQPYQAGYFRGRHRQMRGVASQNENADLRWEIHEIHQKLADVLDMPKFNVEALKDFNQSFQELRSSQDALMVVLETHIAACEEANQNRDSDSEKQSLALMKILQNQTRHIKATKAIGMELQELLSRISDVRDNLEKVKEEIPEVISTIKQEQQKQYLKIRQCLLKTSMKHGNRSSSKPMTPLKYAAVYKTGGPRSHKPFFSLCGPRKPYSPRANAGLRPLSSTPVRETIDRSPLKPGSPACSSRFGFRHPNPAEFSPIIGAHLSQYYEETFSTFEELESTIMDEFLEREKGNSNTIQGSMTIRKKRILIKDTVSSTFISDSVNEV